jgi:hypothetical protein
MLIKEPSKRPSMRKTLEKEFLARRITKLLTSTIVQDEFSETFLQKHILPLGSSSTKVPVYKSIYPPYSPFRAKA